MLYNFVNEALFDADKKQIKNKFLNHLSFLFEHSFEKLPPMYYSNVKLRPYFLIVHPVLSGISQSCSPTKCFIKINTVFTLLLSFSRASFFDRNRTSDARVLMHALFLCKTTGRQLGAAEIQ